MEEDGLERNSSENFYEIVLVLIGVAGLLLLWKMKFYDVFGMIGMIVAGILIIMAGLKINSLKSMVDAGDISWSKVSEKGKERFGLNVLMIVGLVGYAVN